MERRGTSDNRTVRREVCCSLLMLLFGLLFYLALATVTYFICLTIAGWQVCSLWIDIPGRIVIFLLCYYVGSVCGFLPLPQRYHLCSFIVPFNIWRLRSWRRLFRNLFTIPSLNLVKSLRRNVVSAQENLETPLLHNQERTAPIDIPYPETHIHRERVSNTITTPRNEIPGIIKSLNGSITSFDRSVGDILLPIMPEKSSRRHFVSEATVKESEISGNRDYALMKHLKQFAEIKCPGEAAANAMALPSDYQAALLERPVILTSVKKSTALTDDERLAISIRRGLVSELLEVQIKKDLEPAADTRTPETDPVVASERTLGDKYFELVDEKRLVSISQEELQISGKERLKIDTADDRLIFARKALLPEANDQPLVHTGKLHLVGVACSKKETSSEYRNSESQLNFPGTRNRNYQSQGLETDPSVRRKHPLNVKYFCVTNDEVLVTARQTELQISESECQNIDVSTVVDSNICTQTTYKNEEDINKSNFSTKPGEAEADKVPYVKIMIDSLLVPPENDSDSDPERPKE